MSAARRKALITGGSGGIGRACAATLVARGYDVVLTARRPDRLKAVASTIGAKYIPADCSDPSEVDQAVEEMGELSMVIHAAGILDGTFVRNQPIEVFDRVIAANLRSAYIITKAALKKMGPGSRLIYISSTAGLKGMKGLSAYSASKAGIEALAQSVAQEVEREGIAVHLITPAPVRTEMIGPDPGVVMWLLEPDDIASAVGWLDSLHPRVVVREIVLRSVVEGPFAPDPVGKHL